jgi:hypothetical protein
MRPLRTKNIHLVLSEIELHRLQALARNAELNQSVYLRSLIKREWEKGPKEKGRS